MQGEQLEARLPLTIAFEPLTPLTPAITNPTKIVAKDINQDQRIDLVIQGTNQIAWLENLAEGGFAHHIVADQRPNQDSAPFSIIGDSSAATDIAVIDSDVDGDNDVWVLYENDIQWFENTGDGMFAPATIELPERISGALKGHGGDYLRLEDFDNDSDLDLLVVDVSEPCPGCPQSTVLWYEQTSSNVFTDVHRVRDLLEGPTDNRTIDSVVVADVDDDSLLDIVIGEFGTAQWYRNSADGFVAHPLSERIGGQATVALPADADGDGDLDIFTSGLSWLANLGDGTFLANGAEVTRGVRQLWQADIDNDGIQETIEQTLDKITVFGTQESMTMLDLPGLVTATTADLDGDGDKDLVFAVGDEIAWLANDGNGAFDVTTVIQQRGDPLHEGIAQVIIADLNGDGIDDLVTNSDVGLSYQIRSMGGFDSPPVLLGVHEQLIEVDDFDIDELPDVLVADGGTITLYQNGIDGQFQATKLLDIPEGIVDIGPVILVDLDNDTDPDLLFDQWQDGIESVQWMENLADEGQGFATPASISTRRLGLAAAFDADLDGDLDVSTGSGWLENVNGKGDFVVHDSANFRRFVESTSTADIDQDGRLDVLITSDLGVVTLLTSAENGPLETRIWQDPLVGFPAEHSGPWWNQTLVGDFDGDGDSDAIASYAIGGIANFVGQAHFQYFENIDGVLGEPTSLSYDPSMVSVVTDWNSDGMADLVMVYDGRLQVLVNQTKLPMDGDANEDRTVSFADFLILSRNFGREDEEVSNVDGDFDGDGVIGFEDFLILAANFGQVSMD